MQEKVAMPSEQTPLIQSVPVAPPRQRYPHYILRRICTVLLSITCIAALAVFLFILLAPQINWNEHGEPYNPLRSLGLSSSHVNKEPLSLDDVQKIITQTSSASKAREWSKYYTSGPHLAGKNYSQAEWTMKKWKEFGIDNTNIVSYEVYLNYPKHHRLALLQTSDDGDQQVTYEASLEEDVLEEDRTSGLKDRIPTFHGYSASGNVTAPYVFANYGTYLDFEDLVRANVSLEGNIALVKYGKIFRGLKVKRAQELGMLGCIIYSDPGDDNGITEENGYEAYPDGPARNPSSVQRGSVEFLGVAAGDPTTPGYPSKPGVPRKDTSDSMPRIPSLPISYSDALPLLKALNGHGPSASSFNKYWQDGGLGYKGVDYNIGPTPSNVAVNLVNVQEYVTTPLWNVVGVINGSISDEVVILGNHRDAWIAGGAADPNSGSATLNEVVRSMGQALQFGWKPLRTIVFASWDGEEYGLIGSTEWVEEFIPWLSRDALAYLNVDVSTSGPYFHASASPLLDSTIIRAAGNALSPNQTVEGQSVLDTWNRRISSLGSGSDYTAFQDFAGIPSVDYGFQPGGDAPVYHYHSNYDSFDWMDKFGDVGFEYHVAMSKIWGVQAAILADSWVIPFNATNYARTFNYYVETIEKKINESTIPKKDISLDKLLAAIERARTASIKLDAEAAALTRTMEELPNMSWDMLLAQNVELYNRIRQVNTKYKYFERQMLYSKGLDNRHWFKHSIFAPGRWTGYAGVVWPGLVESLEDGDLKNFYRWQDIISNQLYNIVDLIK